MAKRKTVQATAREKAPGVQKSNQKLIVDPLRQRQLEEYERQLAESRAEREAIIKARAEKLERYKHERFVDEYLENGNNATQAYKTVYKCDYDSAHASGSRLLAKVSIQRMIVETRTRWKEAINIDREKLLRVQAAMALASFDDFVEVLANPKDEASYEGLGDKRHAIEGAEEGQHGNKLRLVNKQTALNELWTKLGIKIGTDTGTSDSTARDLLQRVRKTGTYGVGEK